MDTGGFVYLIKENGDSLMHKIGVTKSKDINKRLKALQTGNGNELILINSYWTTKPFKMEQMLHSHFAMQRENGEWFLLSKEDIEGFGSLCCKLQERIDSMKDNPFF